MQAAAIIAGAASVAGPLIEGVGGLRAGQYEQGVERNKALAAQRQGVADEAKIASDARAAAGEAIAAQGASGFQLGTGSALDQLRDNATNAGLDALTVRGRAENERRAHEAAAEQAHSRGINALVGGVIKGVGAGASAAASSGKGKG